MFALHFRSSLFAPCSFFFHPAYVRASFSLFAHRSSFIFFYQACVRALFSLFAHRSSFIFFYQAYVRALFSPFITSHHLPHPAYFRGFFLHFFLLLVASPVSRRNIGSLDWPENFRSHLLPLILWGCHFCLTSNFANRNSRLRTSLFRNPVFTIYPLWVFFFIATSLTNVNVFLLPRKRNHF